MKRAILGRWGAVLAACTGLSLVLAAVLPGRVIPQTVGNFGDVYGTLFYLWWPAYAFLKGLPVHRTPLVEHPFGFNMTYYHPVDYILTAPLTMWQGPDYTWRFLTILSVFLTFVAAERLFSLWIDHRPSRWMAACMAAVGPYHFTQIRSGLDLSQMQWPILAAYGFLKWRRSGERHSLVGGLLASFVCLCSSPYYFVILATFLISIGVPLLFRERANLGSRIRAFVSAHRTGIGLVILGMAAWMVYFWNIILPLFMKVRYDWDMYTYTCTFRFRYYFLPSPEHPIFGRWVGERYPGIHFSETGQYLGAAWLLLVILFLASRRRERPSVVRTAGWIALFFWSLTLQPVSWLVLGPFKTKLFSPFFLYSHLVPFFHDPSRFYLVVWLCFLLVVGLALQWAWRTRRVVMVFLLLWGWGIDYAVLSRVRWEPLPGLPPVYRVLKERPDPKAVLEIPLVDLEDRNRYRMFWDLTKHGIPLVNTPAVYRHMGEKRSPLWKSLNFYRWLSMIPEPSLRFLRRMGAEYLAVDKSKYGAAWEELERILAGVTGLVRLAEDDRMVLYHYRGADGVTVGIDQEDVGNDVFSAPEVWQSPCCSGSEILHVARVPGTGEWAGFLAGDGTFVLRNPGPDPRRITFSLEFSSLGHPNGLKFEWGPGLSGTREMELTGLDFQRASWTGLIPPGETPLSFDIRSMEARDVSDWHGLPRGRIERRVAVKGFRLEERP